MTFENNTRIFYLSSWLKLSKQARDYYNKAHDAGTLNIIFIYGYDA
jgi:hypothetical protein